MNPSTLFCASRRETLATAAGLGGLGALSLLPLPWANAQSSTQSSLKVPEEGLEYLPLTKPAPTQAGKTATDLRLRGKIEVVEFFWYNCPHCNAFEPTLQHWLKHLPKDVHFRRSPVAFNPGFIAQQHLYFTLQAMGKLERFHEALFKTIHQDRVEVSTRAEILAWVGRQNQAQLNTAQFTQLFDSFAIASKATQATQLQTAYGVRGVPALGVAGQFYTDGLLAQSMSRALEVVDYLLAQARKGRALRQRR